MAAPTVVVTIDLSSMGGVAEEGVVITATLDRNEVYNGFVIASEVMATTDEDGVATMELFPNALPSDELPGLGTMGSRYRFTADTSGRRLDVEAKIPNQAVSLHSVILDEDDEDVSPGAIAGSVRYDVAQSLTAPQQAQARANIGFTAAVLATALTGLSLATSTAVTDSDTVLSAIGKLQAGKAALSGAAFTGSLSTASTGDNYLTINSDSDDTGAAIGGLRFQDAGVTRWEWVSNALSEVKLNRFDSSGNFVDQPITVSGATGRLYTPNLLQAAGGLEVTGTLSATGLITAASGVAVPWNEDFRLIGMAFDSTYYMRVAANASSRTLRLEAGGGAGVDGAEVEVRIGVDGAAPSTVATFSTAGLGVNGAISSTGQHISYATGGGTTAAIIASSAAPYLALHNTGSAADNRSWDFGVNGVVLFGRMVNDANSAATNWLEVVRDTMTVYSIGLNGPTAVTGGITTTGGEAGVVLHKRGDSTNAYQLYSAGTDGYLRFYSYGSGGHDAAILQADGTAQFGRHSSGAESMRVVPVASAVNRVEVSGNVTGSGVRIRAAGSDPNIAMLYSSQGAEGHFFATNGFGPAQAAILHTASAVNYLTFTGSATGNAVTIATAGTDANRSIAITPAGGGSVNVAGGASFDTLGNLGLSGQLSSDANLIRVGNPKTPASAADTGLAGQICWDANYIYVCVATDTWRRTAHATW